MARRLGRSAGRSWYRAESELVNAEWDMRKLSQERGVLRGVVAGSCSPYNGLRTDKLHRFCERFSREHEPKSAFWERI
jgi:hypothetical protein